MGVQKLTEQEISAELAALKGWSIQNGKLHRAFECKDFVHAFGFMTSVALTAEAMGHHPDWSNSWNKVTVDLSTQRQRAEQIRLRAGREDPEDIRRLMRPRLGRFDLMSFPACRGSRSKIPIPSEGISLREPS